MAEGADRTDAKSLHKGAKGKKKKEGKKKKKKKKKKDKKVRFHPTLLNKSAYFLILLKNKRL